MLLVGFLAPAVSGAATLSPVVWSEMPATTNGSTNVRYQSFSNPAVNDAGTIAFSATVSELVTLPWYASPKAASCLAIIQDQPSELYPDCLQHD
jgi:hypothetical protein